MFPCSSAIPGVFPSPVRSNVWEGSTDTCVQRGGGDCSIKREEKSTRSQEILAYAESLAKAWKIPGGAWKFPL